MIKIKKLWLVMGLITSAGFFQSVHAEKDAFSEDSGFYFPTDESSIEESRVVEKNIAGSSRTAGSKDKKTDLGGLPRIILGDDPESKTNRRNNRFK